MSKRYFLEFRNEYNRRVRLCISADTDEQAKELAIQDWTEMEDRQEKENEGCMYIGGQKHSPRFVISERIKESPIE